jgi:hypothetical protein
MGYRNKNTAQKITEADVLKSVMQYLKLKKIPCFRINSGALATKNGGFVRFGYPGMSDIYAISPGGISIWIECKRPGGKLSAAQMEFLDMINRNSGIGIMVTSVGDIEKELKIAGVIL